MRQVSIFKLDVRQLKERAAMARTRAGSARTTQERQHFEGMASNLEQRLEDELEIAAADAALAAAV